MQTTNDIFVNPWTIKTKIAERLFDDTEQVWGKTKLLGVKRKQNPRNQSHRKNEKSNFRLFLRLWVCDVIHKESNLWSESKPELKWIYCSAVHFRKSANCGLQVLICGFANRFLTANIFGFAVKNWNLQQIRIRVEWKKFFLEIQKSVVWKSWQMV